MRWIDRYTNMFGETVYVYDYGDVDDEGKPKYRESTTPPDKMPKSGSFNIICIDYGERAYNAVEQHIRETEPQRY